MRSRATNGEHFDVLIIGAGMSGLAAGIRLAHFKKKVVIVERHALWGGLNSFYKKAGYAFDVGLHAVTNWVRPGYKGPRIPLQRIYRQLRLSPNDFELDPQRHSLISFPDAELKFDNNLETLTSEVARIFPSEVDGWVRLINDCEEYPSADQQRPFVSTRQKLGDYFSEPLLIEMLLCPLLFYGSAVEGDVDFEQFVILFNSIYREGFCRPKKGVRQILDVLIEKYRQLGGEMWRNCGVEKLVVNQGRVAEVILEGGVRVTADRVLSSAGLLETQDLRSDFRGAVTEVTPPGQLAFTETLWVLDCPPSDLGWDVSIAFFNRGTEFAWRRPSSPVDLESGVICCPSNYVHPESPEPHVLRATHLADHAPWHEFSEKDYVIAKDAWVARSREVVEDIVGPFHSHIRYTDSFTPRTVTKFTGHRNGAIYGAPKKQKDGKTDLENLFLCGTDQGFVGIVGAMLSGVNMANAHALR